MSTNIETLPLYEDFEQYSFWLIPQGPSALDAFNPDTATTFAFKRTPTTSSYTITAAELTAAGYALTDTVNVAVAQTSAQVGDGFIRKVGLPA
jgi:hypothetical protein